MGSKVALSISAVLGVLLVSAGCSSQVDPDSLAKQETPAPAAAKSMPDYVNPGKVVGRDPIPNAPRVPAKGGH